MTELLKYIPNGAGLKVVADSAVVEEKVIP